MGLVNTSISGPSVTNLQIRPLLGRDYIVTWEVKLPEHLEDGRIDIYLKPYSSDSPFATIPWGEKQELLLKTITNKSIFFFEEIEFVGISKDNEELFKESVLLDPWVDDYVAEALRRDIHLSLSKAKGLLVAAFIRRKWGPKCPSCYSKSTNKLDPQCPVCYGTGFKGGFFGPYPVWGSYQVPKGRSVQQGSPSYVSPIQNRMILESYPPLSPGDVLMLPSNSRWFRVRDTQSLKHKIAEVAQIVSLVGASKDSVVYSLDWRTEEILSLVKEETRNIQFKQRLL